MPKTVHELTPDPSARRGSEEEKAGPDVYDIPAEYAGLYEEMIMNDREHDD